MTTKEKEELKNKVLSFLIDKNVGNITFADTGDTKESEEYGALVAFGYAFKNINKVFDSIQTND